MSRVYADNARANNKLKQFSTAGDRRWLMIVEGQGGDYAGEAVNPRFLSLFETALGYGRRYQAPPHC